MPRNDLLSIIETIDGDIGLEHVPIGVLQAFSQKLGQSGRGTRAELAARLRRCIRREVETL